MLERRHQEVSELRKDPVTPSGMATIDGKGMLTALAPGQAVVKVTTVASPVHAAEAAVTISAAPDVR
jgi:hypothetical protein